jgi:hypothetical protein
MGIMLDISVGCVVCSPKAMKINIDGEILNIKIARPWSLNRMVAEITPLLDLLLKPDTPPGEARDWASLELYKILSEPGNWEVLTHVKPDAKSNFGMHNIGAKRMEWLEKFYEEKVISK